MSVCVLLRFIDPILGNRYGPGVIPLQGTWGGWILTLRLNYVAGYTGPLLFLFDRTNNYYVDNQGVVPWRLRRVGRSKVRSASLVRVRSVALFYVPILGNQCTVPGFHQGEPRVHAHTIQKHHRETSTCLLQTTWGGRILTIHLNYVAGYTRPLLFLFERTQQLTPLTTRGMPWRLRVWAGPMCSDSSVRCNASSRINFQTTFPDSHF